MKDNTTKNQCPECKSHALSLRCKVIMSYDIKEDLTVSNMGHEVNREDTGFVHCGGCGATSHDHKSLQKIYFALKDEPV